MHQLVSLWSVASTCWIFFEKFLLDFSRVTSKRLVPNRKRDGIKWLDDVCKYTNNQMHHTHAFLIPSYLHPSLFGREEDALAWFPQAASPLRGGKHFRFMASNINICAVTCLQVDDSCHRLCNASLVNKRDT